MKLMPINASSHESVLTLAQNIEQMAMEGEITCIAVSILRKDGIVMNEWSWLPNCIEAVGMIELLKQRLMENCTQG
jgi:hypothetical protein